MLFGEREVSHVKLEVRNVASTGHCPEADCPPVSPQSRAEVHISNADVRKIRLIFCNSRFGFRDEIVTEDVICSGNQCSTFNLE